ncbi:MAG TPA: hypothetical protein VN376_03830 [Longilinea sp.]|nr:hypothetical protein [Longilinea sp.]
MDWLLSPPVAFLAYIPLVLIILGIGRYLAGAEQKTEMKSSVYGSGEAAPVNMASPGYKPFFIVAFFFAFLHLGMLILGTGEFNWSIAPFLIGLILALIALILG